MGWPGCMRCKNWPSVGHSGLCEECIKDPKLVAEVADEMFNNSFHHHVKDLESSCLLAFLEREPNGQLVKLVFDKLQNNSSLKVREAIEQVRTEYWSDFQKKY